MYSSTDCDIPNIMCRACWGVITHKCKCPEIYVRFCECSKPDPIDFEEEDDVKEINEPNLGN